MKRFSILILISALFGLAGCNAVDLDPNKQYDVS